MNRIKHLFYFFRGLTAYVLDALLSLLPRNKHKWVFGATGGFRDNPKYLYLETLERHQEIEAVWIGHVKSDIAYLQGKGLKAYYWLSLKGLYHTLTAGVAVCDHALGNINSFLLGGAYYVNLWHGSSVKRVRWQNTEVFLKEYGLKSEDEMRTSFTFKMMQYYTLFQRPDFLLAPSTTQAREFFAPMMDIPLSKVVVGVFPRSRLLIQGKEEALNFIARYEDKASLDFVKGLERYKKTYIYMPTWRQGKADFFAAAGVDWQLLNRCLEERNELLILKLHPFTKLNLDEISGYSHLMVYPKNNDMYAILPFIDCLITDYSSIYTDFLMMDKEIVLFVFDYEEYIHNSNDLGEYDKYFVGTRANDFRQLLQIIGSEADCHVPQDRYQELMEFFWDNNRQRIDIVEEVKKRAGIANT